MFKFHMSFCWIEQACRPHVVEAGYVVVVLQNRLMLSKNVRGGQAVTHLASSRYRESY